MADTKIELSVSGDQAEATIRKILAEFPGEAVLADDATAINPIPAALEVGSPTLCPIWCFVQSCQRRS